MSQKKFSVGIVQENTFKYPTEVPYNPSTVYPEYPFSPHLSKEKNETMIMYVMYFINLVLIKNIGIPLN